MWLRYSGSTAASVLITASLIYWMHLLIAGGAIEITEVRPFRAFITGLIIETPPRKQRRQRPDPPTERPSPPEIERSSLSPATDPVVPDGHATPPWPTVPRGWSDGRPGPTGRRGPWADDSSLMLVAQVQPVYPRPAITRELEGHVVVEYTVTRQGTVAGISVVESSDPLFESAAASAVARFRYRPKIVDGLPVEVRGVRTRLEFRLDD